ncbi:acyltransferase [Bradyrhizobium sp. BR 10289]|uniref:acyltransferase family protein n=1 Tax=Bradyrhizobium sp. BR 10289 TaxID=2749993 RepID=UPI001C64C397|nr:acyltransferase [Bradyrhizobium sp. BR 10289]MBW7971566.1 acyltransferase [Bradyrhizobium sp. BR 10289]
MAMERLQTIDGLRGIAAVTVIVQHCLEFTPLRNPDATMATPIEYIFSNEFNLGRFGVIVFFLISGFLIPSSIRNQPRPLISFAIGRFFRLYPLYWLSMVLALIVGAMLGRQTSSLVEVLVNITMFQKAVGVANVLDPYWTLFVEHLFYLLCAFLFAVGALFNESAMRTIVWASGIVLVLGGLALTLVPTAWYAKHLITLINYPSLIFTMLVGHNIRMSLGRGDPSMPWSVLSLYAAVLLAAYLGHEAYGGFVGLLSSASVMYSTGAALLVFVVVLQTNMLRGEIFAYVGRISYGLYLFHGISLWIAITITGKPETFWESLALLGLVSGITFAVSAITFSMVEEPFIALGKNVRRFVARPDAGLSSKPSIG